MARASRSVLLVALVLAPLLSACGGGGRGSGGAGDQRNGHGGDGGGAGAGGNRAAAGAGAGGGGYVGGAGRGGQAGDVGRGGAAAGIGGRGGDPGSGGQGASMGTAGSGGAFPVAQLGVPCDAGVSVSVSQFFSATPNAPGCSGLCVRPNLEKTTDTGAFCTGDCGSDADCAGGELRNASNVGDKRCQTGFACREIVPDFPGNAASCRSLCICKDFLAGTLTGAAPLSCPAAPGTPPATTSAVASEYVYLTGVAVKADVLFVVDDSSSMVSLQAKLAEAIPAFTNALTAATSFPTDLHIAVVSSSMGAGAWSNVPSCALGHPGNDQAVFQQGPGGAKSGSCIGLHAGETYLKTGDGSAASPPNFDGAIDTTLACMLQLGNAGCQFASPFESAEYALYKASMPSLSEDIARADPDNGGFLRSDAVLAVIMFTDRDDCSVASGSLLFDPSHDTVADPMSNLGGLQRYRCNEFGHLCGGQPPPHQAPASPVMLNGCVSAEDEGLADTEETPNGTPDPTHGHLTTVAELVAFTKSLKQDPAQIVAAAISGPPTPYIVDGFANAAAGNEIQPEVQHSCEQAGSSPLEYGDPAVRIKQWVDAFGANGVFEPICAASLQPAMEAIATAVRRQIGGLCLTGVSDVSHCQVTVNRRPSATAPATESVLPRCDPSASVLPCWRAAPDVSCPAGNSNFAFVPDGAADPTLVRTVTVWCPVE